MRVSRIFIDNPLLPGAEVVFDAHTTRYLVQVLRLREGQRVVIKSGFDPVDAATAAAQLAKLEQEIQNRN